MPRIKKFNRNSKFRGNQFTQTRPNPTSINNDSDRPTPSTSYNSPKKSSSYKKLNSSKLPIVSEYSNTNVNFIVNLEQLSALIQSFYKCKFCDSTDCLEISLDDTFKSSIVHRMVLTCTNCQQFQTKMNSKIVNGVYELNLRYIYALRSIGKGTQAGRTFSAVMNMAAPTNKPNLHNRLILRAATEVCNASLRNAATEAIEDNEGNRDVAAAFDGTWQKRGHTSMNGIVTVTSFDSGKVLDYECLSKYCNFCAQGSSSSTPDRKEEHKNSGLCTQTYAGSSGGMEVFGAKILCARSEAKLGLRYTQYLGDGDSKGFTAVLESKPYGVNVNICKLECVGHVQKRMGTRLRKLKKENKGVKLSDGKLLAGKGRLTDEEIDQLQRYYGLAIRKNTESVEAMQKAIWATFFHKLSSDEKPQHQLCPNDRETWCQYNKQKQKGEVYTHKHSLPDAVMDVIKPVFRDLSNPNLLKRCLHGKTQNPNESLNGVIWHRLPKTVYVGLNVMKLGATDAVMCFNEGSIAKTNVLKLLGFQPGKFMVEGLRNIDSERIKRANIEVREGNKKKRVRRRLLKKKREESDSADYCPGGF